MLNDYNRRSIRLPGHDYNQPGYYFITVCSYNREFIFGEINNNKMLSNHRGDTIRKWWNQISKKYQNIILGAFVIMPNHIHGIIQILPTEGVGAIHESPLRPDESPRKNYRRKMLLPRAVGYFKMNSSKYINILDRASGSPVWQRNYYERIIRSKKELKRAQKYIINNPANWRQDINNTKPIN